MSQEERARKLPQLFSTLVSRHTLSLILTKEGIIKFVPTLVNELESVLSPIAIAPS